MGSLLAYFHSNAWPGTARDGARPGQAGASAPVKNVSAPALPRLAAYYIIIIFFILYNNVILLNNICSGFQQDSKPIALYLQPAAAAVLLVKIAARK